mmetsp:Transcript_12583/g.15487  ORF Transcript_12583/g.15487 Transcript_12583/m.15487 type:complete len:197 (-) Transcript_12583:81-671(-)
MSQLYRFACLRLVRFMIISMIILGTEALNIVTSRNIMSGHVPLLVGTTRTRTPFQLSNNNNDYLTNIVDSNNMHVSSSTTTTTIANSIPNDTPLSSTTNVIIFIIGLIPFLWATYEFWSRIAVGSSFGTGKDSIQIRPSESNKITTIGRDNDLNKSRGQQVLGDDALLVAYFLFAVAIGSVGIAVYSVVSSPSSTF